MVVLATAGGVAWQVGLTTDQRFRHFLLSQPEVATVDRVGIEYRVDPASVRTTFADVTFGAPLTEVSLRRFGTAYHRWVARSGESKDWSVTVRHGSSSLFLTGDAGDDARRLDLFAAALATPGVASAVFDLGSSAASLVVQDGRSPLDVARDLLAASSSRWPTSPRDLTVSSADARVAVSLGSHQPPGPRAAAALTAVTRLLPSPGATVASGGRGSNVVTLQVEPTAVSSAPSSGDNADHVTSVVTVRLDGSATQVPLAGAVVAAAVSATGYGLDRDLDRLELVTAGGSTTAPFDGVAWTRAVLPAVRRVAGVQSASLSLTAGADGHSPTATLDVGVDDARRLAQIAAAVPDGVGRVFAHVGGAATSPADALTACLRSTTPIGSLAYLGTRQGLAAAAPALAAVVASEPRCAGWLDDDTQTVPHRLVAALSGPDRSAWSPVLDAAVRIRRSQPGGGPDITLIVPPLVGDGSGTVSLAAPHEDASVFCRDPENAGRPSVAEPTCLAIAAAWRDRLRAP